MDSGVRISYQKIATVSQRLTNDKSLGVIRKNICFCFDHIELETPMTLIMIIDLFNKSFKYPKYNSK